MHVELLDPMVRYNCCTRARASVLLHCGYAAASRWSGLYVMLRCDGNLQYSQEMPVDTKHHGLPGGSILHMKYSGPRRSRLVSTSASGRRQASGSVTRGSSARARSEKGCHCTPALTSTALVSALHSQTKLSTFHLHGFYAQSYHYLSSLFYFT